MLLSPSTVSQCISIYCEGLFTYRDVVRTWLKRASTLHNFCVTGYVIMCEVHVITISTLYIVWFA